MPIAIAGRADPATCSGFLSIRPMVRLVLCSNHERSRKESVERKRSRRRKTETDRGKKAKGAGRLFNIDPFDIWT